MTYNPKTYAESCFRWSVTFTRYGNKQRKNPKRWPFGYDWEDWVDRRPDILRRIHEREMREYEVE